MIIYIANEIAVRELPAHLLLAVISASRGHQVMIGSINDILLCRRLNILPPGPLMVKNMNVPAISKKSYEKFLDGGFELYCHEQEPSILWSDFDEFLDDYNITHTQFMPFKRVFCWGERDCAGYRKLFSKLHEVFCQTGSPRVDLWRPEFTPIWGGGYIQEMKPYVLFVSNNGFSVGKKHWSEHIKTAIKYECVKSKEVEKRLYIAAQKDMLIVRDIIFTFRELAEKHKDINFVIRPHPVDNEDYWRNAVGHYKNIHVIYQGELSPWIAGAKVVIHNSCSSALESSVYGVPVISYVPSDLCDLLKIPNKIGKRVENPQELAAAVEQLVFNEGDARVMTGATHAVLDPILTIGKDLAALKIIRLIEEASNINKSNAITNEAFLKIRMALHFKVALDKLRGVFLYGESNLFDGNEVRRKIGRISEVLDIPEPKVRFVRNTTMLIG